MTAAVSQAVTDMLTEYLEENPNDARAIVRKVILAAPARYAAREAERWFKEKNVLSGTGLPGTS